MVLAPTRRLEVTRPAEDWYRKSLAINEELGDRPHAAITYAQLALLAEDMGQGRKATGWNIRCVTSIDQFPSVQTGTGATALARLARQFGILVLGHHKDQN